MKALLASALNCAASCLSFSVTSFGSAKLRVDRAGEGTAEESGVEERAGKECDESLMLMINEHSSVGACLFVPTLPFSPAGPAKHTQKILH